MGLVGLRLDLMTDHPPSVLWHCWLGHMTCKNIVPEWHIYCVEWDVKPYSTQVPLSVLKIYFRIIIFQLPERCRIARVETTGFNIYTVVTTQTVFVDSAVEVHLPIIFPLPAFWRLNLKLRWSLIAFLHTAKHKFSSRLLNSYDTKCIVYIIDLYIYIIDLYWFRQFLAVVRRCTKTKYAYIHKTR